MTDFRTVLQSRAAGVTSLHHTSLAFVCERIQQTMAGSFAILSAWRSSQTLAANTEAHRHLERLVREQGLGCLSLVVRCPACLHDPEAPPENLDAFSVLVVPRVTMKVAARWVGRHDFVAPGWVYLGPETGNELKVLSLGTETHIGPLTPGNLEQALVVMMGGPVFVEYKAQSFIEAMIEQHHQRRGCSEYRPRSLMKAIE